MTKLEVHGRGAPKLDWRPGSIKIVLGDTVNPHDEVGVVPGSFDHSPFNGNYCYFQGKMFDTLPFRKGLGFDDWDLYDVVGW